MEFDFDDYHGSGFGSRYTADGNYYSDDVGLGSDHSDDGFGLGLCAGDDFAEVLDPNGFAVDSGPNLAWFLEHSIDDHNWTNKHPIEPE